MAAPASPPSSPAAPSPRPQAVGWLELFYDLVFVAAIVTFSDAVSFDPEPHVIALAVGDGVEFHEAFVSVVYGLLIADVAIMYARMARVRGELGAFAAQRRNEYALATLPMLAAALVGSPGRYVLWAITIAIIVLPGLGYRFGRRSGEVGFDEHHLVERLGLLTIIVCGESFVKVSLLAADGSLEELDLIVISALFILVFSMWWSYVDDVPAAGLSARLR